MFLAVILEHRHGAPNPHWPSAEMWADSACMPCTVPVISLIGGLAHHVDTRRGWGAGCDATLQHGPKEQRFMHTFEAMSAIARSVRPPVLETFTASVLFNPWKCTYPPSPSLHQHVCIDSPGFLQGLELPLMVDHHQEYHILSTDEKSSSVFCSVRET